VCVFVCVSVCACVCGVGAGGRFARGCVGAVRMLACVRACMCAYV